MMVETQLALLSWFWPVIVKAPVGIEVSWIWVLVAEGTVMVMVDPTLRLMVFRLSTGPSATVVGPGGGGGAVVVLVALWLAGVVVTGMVMVTTLGS
jgi:hypothetical protein